MPMGLLGRKCGMTRVFTEAGVTVPVSTGTNPAAGTVSHLEEVQSELISRRYPAGVSAPPTPA